MEATHAQPSTVKIQVQDNETDGICTIKGHVRFKDHYTEKPPRVLAWVQRKNLMTLERMPADTITVTSTGFDVAIRHRDPGMMDGAVINWMAVTPPKSCPGLSAAIEAILACPARTVTPELDAVVAAYLHDGNVGDMDSSGQTLLHAAATAGNSRLVKYLLARGARVNAADEHGWTALLCAISPGFLDTALQLIASGADVSVVTESESNALHYLARLSPAGNTDYIPLLTALLKGGCDPSAPNLDGDTPLSTMCQRAQRVDVIEALIRGAAPSSSSQYCANPNTVNNVGMSPLHWAVEKDMTSVISLLLEFGADPELPSPIGTPLEYAEKLHKTFAVTTMRAVITARQEAVEAAAAAAAAASSASVPTTPRGTESPGGSNVTAEGEGDSASATTVGGVIGGNGDSNGGGGGSACEAKALLVDVIEARDLENARDVYCVVKYMEQENHTSIVSQTSNPVWKAQFRVALAKGRATLILQVLNFQMAKSSELLGTVSLSAKGLRPGIVHDKWYHMESFSQTQQGTVHVRLQALPSSSSSSSSSSFSLPLSTSPFGAPSSSPVPTTTLPITIGGTTTECTFPVEPGFSTLPFPHEEWVSSTTATAGCPIDPSCTEEGRYHIEDSASSVTHSASRDVSWDLDVLSAAHPFAALVEPAPYTTVYGFDGEQPLVASVGCGPGPNGLRRVVMRTAGEDLCLALPPQSQKNDVAALVQAIPALAQVKLTSCKSTSPQVLRMLHNYELVNNKSTMKVGIMYAAEGQKTETEILKNCTGSQCFEDFLSFIGDRVELKNFTKYSGGLITKCTFIINIVCFLFCFVCLFVLCIYLLWFVYVVCMCVCVCL